MRNNMKRFLGAMLLCTVLLDAMAQDVAGKLQSIARVNESGDWYFFDKGFSIAKENINSEPVKRAFGFNSNNYFEWTKTEQDELNIIHEYYQQMFRGYPVQFAQFKLHHFPNRPSEANGNYVPNLSAPIPVLIGFEKALESARKLFPAQTYMWEDQAEEKALRERSQGAQTTYFPHEELVWAFSGKDLQHLDAKQYVLAYKILLHGKLPSFSKEVYIDASNGRLLSAFDHEYHCGNHTFSSNFNGSRIVSFNDIGTTHTLVDACFTGDVISVSDNQTSASPYSKSSAAAWPSNNNFNSACTSLWALRQTENYFFNVHTRSGFDNGAMNVDLRQNSIFYSDLAMPLDSPYYSNASFNGSGICRVGNNQSGGPNGANTTVLDDWNTLDIMAHELAHGVTATSCDLVYSGESGALNESFSDIFGANVYQSVGGYATGHLWKMGYDRKSTSGTSLYIRNMADPNDKGHPDTYMQSGFWVPTNSTFDNGGVHTNSGVQNYMYYLLVEGGSGVNANGLFYNVSGIGFSAARAIAYRTLTVGYLNTNSNYTQARNAWVHAAVDLYGSCSLQAIAVGKAWEAVGFNPPITANNQFCGNYGNTIQVFNSGNPSLVSPGNCGATVLGTGNLVFISSGSYIDIQPGFNTNPGAYFATELNNCLYSNY